MKIYKYTFQIQIMKMYILKQQFFENFQTWSYFIEDKITKCCLIIKNDMAINKINIADYD